MRIQSYLLILLLLIGTNTFSQSLKEEQKLPAVIDHSLITLSLEDFNALGDFLKNTIPKSTEIVSDNHKMFVIPQKRRPYLEIWNSSMVYGVGNQIAFSSNDSTAITKAKRYYNNDGYRGNSFFTIGIEKAAGHPYGGNFFVYYLKGFSDYRKDSVELLELRKIQTIMPEHLKGVKNDYAYYTLEVEEKDSVLIASDMNGVELETKFTQTSPSLLIGGQFGPLALYFNLNKSLYKEEKEVRINENMKALFNGSSMILILKSDAYGNW